MSIVNSVASTVAGLFTSSWCWLKWTLIAAGAAALIGILALLWHDYQSAKSDASRYKTLYEETLTDLHQAANIARRNAEAWDAERQRFQADLKLSAEVSATRLDRLNKLTGQIARLQRIERPDHEKDCPVHPAIVAAFDMLREQDAGTADRADPESENRDPDAAGRTAVVPTGPKATAPPGDG